MLPEAEPADEGVGARAAVRGQLLEILGIAAPEDRVVRLEGRGQAGRHVGDGPPPLLLAQPLQPADAD
jgi:hypothetical protein